MSTAVLPLKRAVWIRPKYVLFALVGLMLAYVLRHNEHFLIDAKDPIWPHYRTIWWYLLPHGMMGAWALLLGPMQFSDRLRARFTKLHRVVGRFCGGRPGGRAAGVLYPVLCGADRSAALVQFCGADAGHGVDFDYSDRDGFYF